MDDLDRKILTLLAKNARMPVKEIAEQVSLTSPAVSSRIHKLETDGIISGYTVTLNRPADRMYVDALISLSVAPSKQDAFLALGVPAKVQTAIEMREVAEPYARRKALSHLEHGSVVIFGAGTGNPFFSTDTTAALRAAEIDADVILLAKNIDGVYDSDPAVNPDAKMFTELTHMEVVEKDLKVMDLTAATLCKDNNIKIHVFAIAEEGNVLKAIAGEKIGTIIK